MPSIIRLSDRWTLSTRRSPITHRIADCNHRVGDTITYGRHSHDSSFDSATRGMRIGRFSRISNKLAPRCGHPVYSQKLLHNSTLQACAVYPRAEAHFGIPTVWLGCSALLTGGASAQKTGNLNSRSGAVECVLSSAQGRRRRKPSRAPALRIHRLTVTHPGSVTKVDSPFRRR
ncbi:hypothetical protein BV25DRAFT_659824 [Artomyces pyxidatus]|uniref:Uncharacterized protein n=1 Tax=Artomyces pyxidatus TaxID=48021 RepID=A0ACB8T0L5_9AGAM|nr:hypothetical protein BV25DRAFT_659824 [Artomyces pyxidatus]